MSEEYVPTGRQMAWLAVLVVVGIGFGLGVGVAIFGVPHLPPPGGGGGPPGGPPPETVEITLVEFSIVAAPDTITKGSVVDFAIANNGTLQHDFKIDGEFGVERVEPGSGTRYRFGPVTEEVTAWCTVLGHREQGMQVTIHVSDAPSEPDA